MAVATVLGTVARWVPRHGAARLVLGQAARRGDQRARMIIDTATASDPYEAYELIRRRGRLVPGRLLTTTVDHEIAGTVLRSDAFGAPVLPDRLPAPLRVMYRLFPDELALGPVDPPSMLAVDPPDHTRYRRLVSKAFTARAIEALRQRTEELTGDLLDELDKGPDRADLVDRLAAPLPVTVIAEVLGVPLDRRDDLLRWGHAAAPALDLGLRFGEYRKVENAVRSFNRYMSGHLDRLAAHPGEDILSRLVTQRAQGEQLTRVELLATASLLLGAGFETTVNLIGNGIVLLLRHPEQLAALRGDPALWPGAVEEILRYDSPVQNTARRALKATEVAGHAIGKDTVIGILLGGANRDPVKFPDPTTFDVRRANAREHLAFSAGVHFCLGAALARMEAETALRRLFERFPDIRLAGEPQRRPTRTLHGYRSVPVQLR
jgi:cytochrome P450